MKITKVYSILGLCASVLLFAYCNRELSSTSPEVIPQGKILIDSNPMGAEIFFENENTGKLTPDSITHLATGTYEIMLRMELFLDTTLTIEVTDQQVENINLDYLLHERNFGTIICTSIPENALIYLNDSCTSLFTPQVIQFIWPGDYEVKYTYPEHRADSLITTLSAGIIDTIYMALQDTSVWVNYNSNNSGCPPRLLMSNIAVDHNGVKWIGTTNNGVIKFDGRSWTIYDYYHSPLPWYRVNCISIDPHGKKWIGTSKGLAIFDDVNWIVDNAENSPLPNNFINDVAFDEEGNAYIAASAPTGGRYLAKFNGANWNIMEIDEIISTLEVDSDNNIWIGTNTGLMMCDGENWIDYRPHDYGYYIQNINSIAIVDVNNVWIYSWPRIYPPTPGGLYNYNGKEFLKFQLPTSYISKIIADEEGNIWAATGSHYSHESTSGGLIKIEPTGNFIHYHTENSDLPDNYLRDVALESNGDVWIISLDEGLIKFKSGNL